MTMTLSSLMERYLESDKDKDGKLSKEVFASMDARRQQGLAEADKNADGTLDESELKLAAAAVIVRMRERMQEGGGGGGGGRGGRRGGGEGPPGGGPAGGGQ